MPSHQEQGIGERLRTAREAKGWSTRDLDERAGLSEGYTWKLEAGHRRVPTYARLTRLAKVLGVTVEWLVGGARRAG